MLLLVPTVLPLLVGTYDRTEPELAGFPFYFWWQFALIAIAAMLTLLAFRIASVATRRDRLRRGQDSRAGSAQGGER